MTSARNIAAVTLGERYRVWLCAYAPQDQLSRLYEEFAVAKAQAALIGTTQAEVHAWIRKKHPELVGFLDAVESGAPVERIVPPGEFPTSPDPAAAPLELHIVQHLQARRAGLGKGVVL